MLRYIASVRIAQQSEIFKAWSVLIRVDRAKRFCVY
jgi:hypothetical protein